MATPEERIQALEQKIEESRKERLSLLTILSEAPAGTRFMILYVIIAAIVLPALALYWFVHALGDNPANARSLITIVFCLGTMALAGYISYVAIRNNELDKAKEVLIILIGIFGTIVGYYFGSDRGIVQSETNQKPTPAVTDEQLDIADQD